LTVVGLVGIHGAAVRLCVVENLGPELDLAPLQELLIGANHVME